MSDSELNPKLEWMYKTGKDMVNREEYLLGKKVDKQFEESSGNAVESEVLPERVARINYDEFDKFKDQVDIARKQIEDPLMLIKQKEIEARRKILENPVKLKKLHELLKKDSITKQPSKKKKKKEKKRSSSSSNSDSDENLDKLLLKKYRELQGKKSPDSNDGESFIDKKFQALTKELDKFVKKKKSKNRARSSSSPERRRNSPPSRRYNRSPPRRRSRSPRRNHRSPIRRRSRSAKRSNKSPPKKRSRSPRHLDRNESSRRKSPARESKPGYGLVSAGGEKIELKSRDEVRWYSKSELKSSSRTEQKKVESRRKESLTEAEKEKRRREMMDNANWREKDREMTVKRYRKNEEKEEVDQQKEFDKNFLDKHLRKAQQQTNSLESRIKSNLNNIQRTTSTMNTNFAKR